MCGIVGAFFARQHLSTNAHAVIEDIARAMTHALVHRGPDDGRTFVQSRPGYIGALGFRRLAILDPHPRAMQPMHSDDGRYSVIFNGEIYNFRQLRNQLSPRLWHTTGDTEVILAAYQQWGDQCLDHFRGMFALAIVDWHNHILFLARDRMGQKPLYLSKSPPRLAFASELGALKQLPDFDHTVRDSALLHYLRYGYVTPGESIYAGCIQLLPGQSMIVDLASEFRSSTRFYFEESRNAAGVTPLSVRQHLERAVEEQLVSDVPVGVFLSGGIDSSVIALCARMHGKVRTFSIGFDDGRYDESQYAREVAKHLDTEHHEFRASVDVVQDLPRLASVFGEPFADSSMLPTRLLCEHTRGHVKVALSGDGGDELFGGYDRYRAMRLAARYGKLVPDAISARLAKLDAGHPKSKLTRLGRLMRSIKHSPAERYTRIMRIFADDELEQLFARRVLPQLLTDPSRCHTAADCLWLDRQTYLPGDLLTKVDRCSMLHALEVRSPFMDHELVNHVSGLEDDALFTGGAKGLLKQAFSSDLPSSVFGRAKQGFAVPIGQWIARDLWDWSRQVLLNSRGFAASRWNLKAVDRWLNEHRTGRRDHTARLWSLICLEHWHGVG